LLEAAHLLAGKEPVPPDRFDVHPSARGPEQDLYAALKDAVLDTKSIEGLDGHGTSKYMLRRVRAFDVVTWAKRSGWEVPEAFADLPRPTVVLSDEVESAAPEHDQEPEDAIERRARILQRHETLVAQGDPSPTKTVAAEEGVTDVRIRQLLETARKDREREGETPSDSPIGHPLDLAWRQPKKP
jgi:hypothetical protein